MTWTPFLRVVGLGRRSRRAAGIDAAALAHADGRRRHPAMAGLDVSPVHGRHCICQRCERQSRAAG